VLMAGLIIECKRDEACGGIKLPIVNRPRAHSSVTDASGAHLRFQGPEPAVCRRCLTCHMGSHSITCHPIQVNPSLPYIWEKGQTSSYYCRNLPSREAGTNLYCLMNRGTCVNNLPKVVTWQCPGSESNLQPQDYKFGKLLLHYQTTCGRKGKAWYLL